MCKILFKFFFFGVLCILFIRLNFWILKGRLFYFMIYEYICIWYVSMVWNYLFFFIDVVVELFIWEVVLLYVGVSEIVECYIVFWIFVWLGGVLVGEWERVFCFDLEKSVFCF